MIGEVAGMRTFPERILTPEQVQFGAYRDIEDKIWAKYGNLRKINDQIKKLEREDEKKARRMLAQYPAIVMARNLIAQEKKRWKTLNFRT